MIAVLADHEDSGTVAQNIATALMTTSDVQVNRHTQPGWPFITVNAKIFAVETEREITAATSVRLASLRRAREVL